MSSSGRAASKTSILPRLVRSLSAFHATKKEQTTGRGLLGTAFSRKHFPKTMAVVCIVSFGVGFHGMTCWQQNRQLRWERTQEELEFHYYDKHITNKQQTPPRKTTTTSNGVM